MAASHTAPLGGCDRFQKAIRDEMALNAVGQASPMGSLVLDLGRGGVPAGGCFLGQFITGTGVVLLVDIREVFPS
jgi:hypothetical protein